MGRRAAVAARAGLVPPAHALRPSRKRGAPIASATSDRAQRIGSRALRPIAAATDALAQSVRRPLRR